MTRRPDGPFQQYDKAGIGTRLQRARLGMGLSQEAIAKHFGTQTSTVSDWENGKETPRLGRLIELARLYGLSLHFLITEQEVPDRASEEELAAMRRLDGSRRTRVSAKRGRDALKQKEEQPEDAGRSTPGGRNA